MKNLRQEFADTVLDIGQKDERLIVMVGDISHGILQPYAKKCPDRYYNIGICEPSTVNMAAGLSKVGLIPVVHTIAPFLIERSYEQIKLDFGYQKLPINLISVGGSFDYSQLGCSHHCYTDVSLMSHLKRSNVFIPGSALEFKKLFQDNYFQNKINYFRLTENPHGQKFNFSEINTGESIIVKEGYDLTIAVTGPQLKTVLNSIELLNNNNISAEILYFHTFKPFDNEKILSSVSKTRRLLVVEELSNHDGLYNQCIRQIIGLNNLKVDNIAIDDFIYGYGSYDDLCEKVGLTPENITKKASCLTSNKQPQLHKISATG